MTIKLQRSPFIWLEPCHPGFPVLNNDWEKCSARAVVNLSFCPEASIAQLLNRMHLTELVYLFPLFVFRVMINCIQQSTLLSVLCRAIVLNWSLAPSRRGSKNGTLIEAENVHIHPRMYDFYLQLVSRIDPTTVQMPNLEFHMFISIFDTNKVFFTIFFSFSLE